MFGSLCVGVGDTLCGLRVFAVIGVFFCGLLEASVFPILVAVPFSFCLVCLSVHQFLIQISVFMFSSCLVVRLVKATSCSKLPITMSLCCAFGSQQFALCACNWPCSSVVSLKRLTSSSFVKTRAFIIFWAIILCTVFPVACHALSCCSVVVL